MNVSMFVAFSYCFTKQRKAEEARKEKGNDMQ